MSGYVATDKALLTQYLNGSSGGEIFNEFFTAKEDYLLTGRTLISMVDRDKKVVLVPLTDMTTKLSKRKASLVKVAVDMGYKVLPIPFERKTISKPSNDLILKRFESIMDSASIGNELALVTNRRTFINAFSRYSDFVDFLGTKPKNFEKFETINKNIEDTNYIRRLQANRRKFEKNKDTLYEEVLSEHDFD